ncbi:MAG: rhodanese-like domain-containing protein [Weeksellaceae bacterium]|nr:rhodanese-like domain-containing protein [Weeksellaceae bacterium]
MLVKQFVDAPLAHFSYAIVSNGKMALVDPARNPQPYYKFAEEQEAEIVAVFETHPHADFISGHLQIHHETGADIYISEKVGVSYPHKSFDHGDSWQMGDVKFSCIFTPGHSPDSISIVAESDNNTALFSGDTLFIGNVGRPDLREKAGNMKQKREELAAMMYETMQTKYNDLPDDTLVYPAHGAGSLCGKGMSDATSGILGHERKYNWAFNTGDKDEFVKELLSEQPMIPAYFGNSVEVNRKGAEAYAQALGAVKRSVACSELKKDLLVIDVREENDFKHKHIPGSINIMARNEKDKFETWLGATVQPDENFYLVVNSVKDVDEMLDRVSKIGYEANIEAVITLAPNFEEGSTMDHINLQHFKEHPASYTIVDIRNVGEVENKRVFDNAINIPLHELRGRVAEIPVEKPIVVHCAGGYRSATGSSIVANELGDAEIYDLSFAISEFN